MFGSRLGKNFTYKVGVRTEVSILSLSSRHNDFAADIVTPFFLPSLSASYKLSDKQSLDFALSRRIGYPTYPQLNPYMSMVDATTFEQGNMYLQPERGTKVDLSYSISNGGLKFFADGYMNYTADYISQITTFNENKLITTYVNVASDMKTGLDLSLNLDVTSWFNVLLASNTYYVKSDGEYKGAAISNGGVTNNSNITLDFITWRGMNIQCQYFVTTPQYFPQLTTALTQQMNVGLKQHFYSVPITVSLLVTDVFNTAKWEVSSFNNVFDLTNISRNKSRMLWLGISYNFNSFKQKSSKKVDNDRSLIRLGL
jgi:outer membrane receptor protein involved in Fe transport